MSRADRALLVVAIVLDLVAWAFLIVSIVRWGW